MIRPLELLAVSYLLNSVSQVPLVFAGAWLASRTLRRQPVVWTHRLWVGTLLFEVTLPALAAHPATLWTAVRTLLLAPYRPGMGAVTVLQGTGVRAAAGLAVSPEGLALISALYGGLVAFFAIRLAWNLLALGRLRSKSRPATLSARSAQLWRECQSHFGLSGIELRESSDVASPLTLGVLRRTVLVPIGLIAGLSEGEQRTLFAHECAHMQRHDFAFNLVYELFALPLAFHPCLRLTRTRLVESREWVCDAAAANILPGTRDYARSLLRLATLLLAAKPATAPHAIGMLDANALERRLMLLSRTSQPGSLPRRLGAIATCTALAFGISAAACALHTPVLAAAAAAQNTGTAGLRIPSGVIAGNLLSRVNPVYPSDAKQAHIEGSVVLAAVIGKDGGISSLHVVSGPQELQQSAMDAVQHWVYMPYLLNGEPTEVETTITVNYQLND